MQDFRCCECNDDIDLLFNAINYVAEETTRCFEIS